jgi:hypothetical protein
MTGRSFKTYARRVGKLEVRFEPIIEATRKVADPFSPEAIVLRLAAGEWQCALKLLEIQQCHRCRAWRPEPRDLLDIPFRDLTRLRRTLARSLGALPEEQRFDIARQLLAADTSFEGEGTQR